MGGHSEGRAVVRGGLIFACLSCYTVEHTSVPWTGEEKNLDVSRHHRQPVIRDLQCRSHRINELCMYCIQLSTMIKDHKMDESGSLLCR